MTTSHTLFVRCWFISKRSKRLTGSASARPSIWSVSRPRGISEAVKFYFPLSSLRCNEKYDRTGQRLLDAGTVLNNGERVALDMQIVEAGTSH